MAALDYTDDDELKSAPTDPILTWNWATWPSNLRKAAIFAVIVIAALIALFALLRWADKDFSKKLRSQTALKQTAVSKLQNSNQERMDIETNLPLLRQLEAANIYGEEKRLEWVELLRIIEKRWPGVRIQYSIAAQSLINQPTTPTAAPVATPAEAGTEPPKRLGVYNSEMRLTLSLLHEGDALAIIEELKAGQLGRFKVRFCSFKRVATETPANPALITVGRPVESECVLTWISMRAYSPN